MSLIVAGQHTFFICRCMAVCGATMDTVDSYNVALHILFHRCVRLCVMLFYIVNCAQCL